jgi:hypothetical protein
MLGNNAASQKKKGEKGRSKLRNEDRSGGKKLPAFGEVSTVSVCAR